MRCHLPALDLHVGHFLHVAARFVAVHPTAVSLFIVVPLLAVPLLFWVDGLRKRRARGSAAPFGAPRLAFPAKRGRAGTLVSN